MNEFIAFCDIDELVIEAQWEIYVAMSFCVLLTTCCEDWTFSDGVIHIVRHWKPWEADLCCKLVTKQAGRPVKAPLLWLSVDDSCNSAFAVVTCSSFDYSLACLLWSRKTFQWWKLRAVVRASNKDWSPGNAEQFSIFCKSAASIIKIKRFDDFFLPLIRTEALEVCEGKLTAVLGQCTGNYARNFVNSRFR